MVPSRILIIFMKYLLLLSLLFTGCTTCQYKSPRDYYRQRQSEDSINWGPNDNNNMLDSPDGSKYHNRTVEIFGASY